VRLKTQAPACLLQSRELLVRTTAVLLGFGLGHCLFTIR
jgi:hypothetical protein